MALRRTHPQTSDGSAAPPEGAGHLASPCRSCPDSVGPSATGSAPRLGSPPPRSLTLGSGDGFVPHACVQVSGSADTEASFPLLHAPLASAHGVAQLAFTETDGVHSQNFKLNGNAIAGGAAQRTDVNGAVTAVERHGPTLWERTYLMLMPEGYPNSVTSDYLVHQIWDALNFASYNVMATLATKAMLKGVGVGSGESTVLSGTIVWLMKDISALLSSIGVAVKLANDLDNDAKQWRMFADITTDIGLLLEVYSEHMSPSVFVVVICVASMFRSVWTVAGWSSRVALTQHFAIRNNMADVSARNGAQETLFTLIGMLGGMYMAYAMAESSNTVQAVYFIGGTLIHLYFNYKSVKSLILTNFNKHRALICINRFFATGGASVCCPDEANDLEPVMWWREPFVMTFGVRPSDIKAAGQRATQQQQQQQHGAGGGLFAVLRRTLRVVGGLAPSSVRRALGLSGPSDGSAPLCSGREVTIPPAMLSDAIRHVMAAPEGRRFALLAAVPRPSPFRNAAKAVLTMLGVPPVASTASAFDGGHTSCVGVGSGGFVAPSSDGGGSWASTCTSKFRLSTSFSFSFREARAALGAELMAAASSGGRTHYDVLLREGAGDEESLWAFFLACKAEHEGLAVGAHMLTARDGDGCTAFKSVAEAHGWDMDKLQFRVFDWRIRETDGEVTSAAEAAKSA